MINYVTYTFSQKNTTFKRIFRGLSFFITTHFPQFGILFTAHHVHVTIGNQISILRTAQCREGLLSFYGSISSYSRKRSEDRCGSPPVAAPSFFIVSCFTKLLRHGAPGSFLGMQLLYGCNKAPRQCS